LDINFRDRAIGYLLVLYYRFIVSESILHKKTYLTWTLECNYCVIKICLLWSRSICVRGYLLESSYSKPRTDFLVE